MVDMPDGSQDIRMEGKAMTQHPGRSSRNFLAALAALTLVACFDPVSAIRPASAEQAVAAKFRTITTEQLARMLDQKDFLFVNVHIPYEGEIAQTDLFIPFDEVRGNLDLLPADKSAPLVLYCRSGRMSEIAAGDLAALGYTNVSHVAGGMVEWARRGRDVLSK